MQAADRENGLPASASARYARSLRSRPQCSVRSPPGKHWQQVGGHDRPARAGTCSRAARPGRPSAGVPGPQRAWPQVLGREADVRHAQRIGMGASVGLGEGLPARRRQCPGAGVFQAGPGIDSPTHARIACAFQAQDQMLCREPRLLGEGLERSPMANEAAREARPPLGHAVHSRARSSAAHANRQADQLHGDAGVAPCRFQLGARARCFAREAPRRSVS